MKNPKEIGLFETTDIALVATARYFGYRIDAIDKNNPSRAVFYLERDEGFDDLLQGFWSKTLQVDPLGFFNALKETKTRLYQ